MCQGGLQTIDRIVSLTVEPDGDYYTAQGGNRNIVKRYATVSEFLVLRPEIRFENLWYLPYDKIYHLKCNAVGQDTSAEPCCSFQLVGT